jgi:hypothetical protein
MIDMILDSSIALRFAKYKQSIRLQLSIIYGKSIVDFFLDV